MKFYPYKKGVGVGKALAILKGGTTRFVVVLTQVLEVLTILMGGATSFPPFEKKGEGA